MHVFSPLRTCSVELHVSQQGVSASLGGLLSGVAGWEDVRLMAPQAELRLLLCGVTSLIDPKRMGYLSALKAISFCLLS